MNRIFTIIKKDKIYYLLISLILLFGIIIRIKAFLIERSLWHDECSLAINILHKNVFQFLGPLEHFQCAPPIFMSATKVLTQIFKPNEYTFRLIPFLAGISSLPLFFWLTTKIFKRQFTQIIATILIAVNYNLIYYAQEFKQYSLDVFCTILLTLILPQKNLINFSNKNLILIGLLFALFPLISFPTIFVILAYLIQQIISYKKQIVKQLGLISIFPIISGLLIIIPNIVNNKNQLFLINYFETDGFLSLNPIKILSAIKLNYNYFFYPNNFILIGIIISIISIIYLCKSKLNQYQNLLIGTLIISIIASFFHIYPMYERVSLFLIPCLIFFLLIPIDKIRKSNPIKSVIILFLTSLYFCNYIPNFYKDFNIIIGINRENAKNSLQFIKTNYQTNDIIVFNTASDSEFAFYSQILNFTSNNIKVNLQTTNQEEYNQLLNQLPKGNTYWFYYPYSLSKYPEKDLLKTWLKDKNVIISRDFQNSLVAKVKL